MFYVRQREMGNENLMLAFIETFSPPEEVDMHAKKTLEGILFSYANREKTILANAKYIVDGKNYDTIMDILFEISDFNLFQIYFVKPRRDQNWEYDVPTVEMKIKKGGAGTLTLACPFNPFSVKRWEHLEPIEEEAMFRFYYLDFFYPESIRSQSLRGDMERKYPFTLDLFLFEDFLKFARKFGVLPLVLRACVYTKHFRFTYDIEIVSDNLIANFRAGKFPVSARVFRHPKQYYYLDRTLASADIGEHPKKVLETAFETRGVTVSDIANAYGLSERMAEGSLEVCVKYGFLEKVGKPPRITYVPRFENFGGEMEYTPPVPVVEVEKKEEEVVVPEDTICPVCHGRKSADEIVCPRCAKASEIVAEEKDESIREIAEAIFSREEESQAKEQIPNEEIEEKEAHVSPESAEPVSLSASAEAESVEEGQAGSQEQKLEKTGVCPSCGYKVSEKVCTSCGFRLG